jgi:hypothetical protein
MCCDGLHDVQAKLDIPGQVRFVTVCALCGREQRELGRRTYTPAPRLFMGPDPRRGQGARSPAVDLPQALGPRFGPVV